MVKKVLALAAVALLLSVGAAQAQDYPPAGNSLVASDSSVEPGDPITLTARSFVGDVDFTMFSAPALLGTAVADASGVATLTTTIPAGTADGTHSVEATGTGIDGQPLTVVTSITVGTAAAGDQGDLATTGSGNSTPMSRVAIAAIAGGGLLVLLANKRRAATKTDTRETADV